MIFKYQDYREFLKDCYCQKVASNPRYSLRSFAKTLGISPPWLSAIFKHKKGLSQETGAQIAEKLQLNQEEKDYFCELIKSSDSRSKKSRLKAQETLRKTYEDTNYLELKENSFELISKWYHLPIIELLQLEDFTPSPSWIGSKLGIQPIEAERALSRLIQMGLIQENNGKLQKAQENTSTLHNVPSSAIRMFHREMLEKSKKALDEQSVEERDITSMTFAIDPKLLPEAKEKIKIFRREMNQLFRKGESSQVYHLSVQLFNLLKEQP